jgi:uncharacterized protein YfaS (alpha-2-macroglobulin family)
METKGPRNEVVHTAFPLSQTAEPRQPGVYLIVAANAADLKQRAKDKQFLWQRSDNSEFAAQVVVQTDIALTTVTAADGLHIFTRSLSNAGPLSGIEVQLMARDSQILGKATTDATGHAAIAPGLLRGTGAASAYSVVAYGPNQDFAILDVTQAAFDLSDRGVAGRDVPGPLDAFVYTDRGIYRPGEQIHAMALLRDRVGAAIDDGGITLSLHRPNGVVFKRSVLAIGAGVSLRPGRQRYQASGVRSGRRKQRRQRARRRNGQIGHRAAAERRAEGNDYGRPAGAGWQGDLGHRHAADPIGQDDGRHPSPLQRRASQRRR